MRLWGVVFSLTLASLLYGQQNSQTDHAHFPLVGGQQDSLITTHSFINKKYAEKLKSIRENFVRINTISKWDSISEIKLWESTEGGYARYYLKDSIIEKIITHHFGETFQELTEYYLRNGELSFVFEKSYHYNRPIYWTKEFSGDIIGEDEEFDFEKSEIFEDRSYFDNRNLFHQTTNQDCGAPFSADYLFEEQLRLSNAYKELLKKSGINNKESS